MAATMKDKVAIVTGGGNGIGAAIVALFLEQGAKVAAVDIIEQPGSDFASRINMKCNVTSKAEVEETISQVVEKFGGLSVLVNCAGVMDGFERVGKISDKTWERCMAVNVTGPMYTMRHAIPELLKTQGVIVNICSAASKSGASAGVAYTASKHALLGMTRHTAYTYGKSGIRCSAVLPGGVETDIMKNSATQTDMEGLESIGAYHKCMLGVAKPADVAGAVLLLATNTAISGAELTVDGGWTAA